MKHIKLLLIAALLVISAPLSALPASALGSATLTMSPGSGSYDIGSTITVNIVENSGAEQINAVQSNLTYDASKLQFLSINTGSSSFNTGFEAAGGNGSVRIARAHTAGSLTGSQTVGSVQFKVLVGSGSTSLSFASSSAIARSSDSFNVWTGSAAAISYNLTTPAPAPAPPPNSTPTSPAPTGPAPTNTTKPANGAAPTNKPGDKPAAPATPAAPNTPATNTPETPKEPVAPKAPEITYTTRLKLKGADGKPLANTEVRIKDTSEKTNNQGEASFANLPAGNYIVTVKGYNTTIAIKVDESKPASEPQDFDFILASAESKPPIKGASITLVLLIAIVAASILVLKRLGYEFVVRRAIAPVVATEPAIVTSSPEVAPTPDIIKPDTPQQPEV